MSDTVDILKKLALQVRNATTEGENTAERIGRVLLGLLDHLSDADVETLSAFFVRKDKEDTVAGLLTLLKGLQSQGNIDIGTFVTGLLGSGIRLSPDGRIEARGMTLWEDLTVPELRYNRVKINPDINFDTFGGGIIESVEIDADESGHELQSGIITLRLEDGDIGRIDVDDMAMSMFHCQTGNDTAYYDGKNMNFRFAGFSTSYFRITEILDTERYSQFRYALRGTSESWTQLNHPQPQAHFACFANPTNKGRQACRYTTTTYSIGLRNMTTWEYGESNIYSIDGILDGFSLNGKSFSGAGQVIGNGYYFGTIAQFENQPWRLGITSSTDGFLGENESTEITCNVTKGFDDLTYTVEVWKVTRESGNQAKDDVWNIAHKDFAGTIIISYSDLGTGLSTLFRFYASSGSDKDTLELTI